MIDQVSPWLLYQNKICFSISGHWAKHIWLTMFRFYDGNRNLYRELLSSTVLKVEAETPAIRNDEEKAAGRMAGAVDGTILSMSLFSQYFGVEVMFFRDPAMTPETAAEIVQAMNQQTLTGLVKTKSAGKPFKAD